MIYNVFKLGTKLCVRKKKILYSSPHCYLNPFQIVVSMGGQARGDVL